MFLSSYSAIAKLSYLIGDSVLLAISSWKVQRARPRECLLAAPCPSVSSSDHAHGKSIQ